MSVFQHLNFLCSVSRSIIIAKAHPLAIEDWLARGTGFSPAGTKLTASVSC